MERHYLATASSSAATSAAACGRASATDALAIAVSVLGSESSAPTACASVEGVSSPAAITTAAPLSAIQRALEVWWSAEAYGYGTRMAGRPCEAISKTD